MKETTIFEKVEPPIFDDDVFTRDEFKRPQWMRKRQAIVLSKEELIELLRDAHKDGIHVGRNWIRTSILDQEFKKFLETKEIVKMVDL